MRLPLLRRLAGRPRLWLCDGFLSPEACAVMRDAVARGAHGEGSRPPAFSAVEQAVVDDLAARIGALTRTPPQATETPLAARRTPPSAPGAGSLPLGLHVDVFQGSARRFVTGLVYLSGGVDGGETAFPLATPPAKADCESASPVADKSAFAAALADAEALLGFGFCHTTAAMTPVLGENGGYDEPPEAANAAAARLLAWADGEDHEARLAPGQQRGLRVQPREGRLLLFFTRTEDGRLDPYSWHGGCTVGAGGALKVTAQAFKELPPLGEALSNSAGCEVGPAGRRHIAAAISACTLREVC